MSTRCEFGILVFGSGLDLVYRFLTNDLSIYLQKRLTEKGLWSEVETPTEASEHDDPRFSMDDALVQHFSTLITFYSNTVYNESPIRQITLESNMKLFFDQIGGSNILCMADDSFNTLVVLKTINLYKALVKFHIGVLSFEKSSEVKACADRISSTLQYYLNNVTTNQSLIFESCEHLHINSLILQQCLETCTIVNQEIQSSIDTVPTMVLLTCKDKIVYTYFSNDRFRPSTSDMFLLVLNATSQPSRAKFQSQRNDSSSTMAHIYPTSKEDSMTSSFDSSSVESTSGTFELLDDYTMEVIFMKTSMRSLAPFTVYTIRLTQVISMIILIEWKTSSTCSNLFELINQTDLSQIKSQFNPSQLSNIIKPVETNPIIRRHFENQNMPLNILSTNLNDIRTMYKSLKKQSDLHDENNQTGCRILSNLSKINKCAVNIFRNLYFQSPENILTNTRGRSDTLTMDTKETESSSIISNLRNKVLSKLEDWFSFIETKSQRNITLSFCQSDFPGLVHFVFIDRARGHICTPTLSIDENPQLSADMKIKSTSQLLERKILSFELECLSALQRGCTSYTVTDEHFTYNYILRLQESNGASTRLYKTFVKSQPPGILHHDFYKALAYENYSSIAEQTSLSCFEMICVHLRVVPSSVVREQCEQLWPRLAEFDE